MRHACRGRPGTRGGVREALRDTKRLGIEPLRKSRVCGLGDGACAGGSRQPAGGLGRGGVREGWRRRRSNGRAGEAKLVGSVKQKTGRACAVEGRASVWEGLGGGAAEGGGSGWVLAQCRGLVPLRRCKASAQYITPHRRAHPVQAQRGPDRLHSGGRLEAGAEAWRWRGGACAGSCVGLRLAPATAAAMCG